ncbi:MAG: thioredoxin family protein [Gammaproteobacteria bacterium]
MNNAKNQSWEDGWVAVVKEDCPTCVLVEPVLKALRERDPEFAILVQDNPDFPDLDNIVHDDELRYSYELNIETVPTLIKMSHGEEVERAVGWNQADWENLTGVQGLGADLPVSRPGCGSLSVEPGVADRLALRFGNFEIKSRRIEVSPLEDEIEYCFERGWSDGLPLVPPSEERLFRMLQGTKRDPQETLGEAPPNMVACTVEKVAINAVMAGCKPEYLPVVIAAVEAALDPAFCMHGLLATTWFSGPMIIVNGPIRKAIGMNWQGNALGQGNRANATIGRALQLVIRNVGGGKPQEVDMSALGSPVKYGFCFAEDEDTPWTSLAEDAGYSSSQSTVTLFTADGLQGCADQTAREPEKLVYSLANSLKSINHIDMAGGSDAVVVIPPEHGRIFDRAGWSKAQAVEALHASLQIPGKGFSMVTGGKAKNTEPAVLQPKFRPEGLTLVRAGGQAGLFSAIISGWVMNGSAGSEPVTKEIIL